MDFKPLVMRGVRWLLTGLVVLAIVGFFFPGLFAAGLNWILGRAQTKTAAA